ncbi:MAG TPA: hypothetical protein VF629_03085 [Hymenobacter sp.]|jgi:hypothetical protein
MKTALLLFPLSVWLFNCGPETGADQAQFLLTDGILPGQGTAAVTGAY